MTGTFYRTGFNKIDHSAFGGVIYQSDFNTNNRKLTPDGSVIAQKIMADKLWMEKLIKIAGNKNYIKTKNGGINNA
ncbi:hypothetical protein AMURIS_05424 [Acetatifactor muris]|uniref:Uncharacterized protein n=2 Tax=Acetatifactor muris TaxID=879566 RepID=A0A2K4ZQ88_9FIRM|nr:hypothetical protein AMURIS_05424 [Acetatifactor muris]